MWLASQICLLFEIKIAYNLEEFYIFAFSLIETQEIPKKFRPNIKYCYLANAFNVFQDFKYD